MASVSSEGEGGVATLHVSLKIRYMKMPSDVGTTHVDCPVIEPRSLILKGASITVGGTCPILRALGLLLCLDSGSRAGSPFGEKPGVQVIRR